MDSFFSTHLIASSPNPNALYRIVFVHIGENLPDYIFTAISQAYLFNPNAEIILVADQKAINNVPSPSPNYLTIFQTEKLKKTREHIAFIKNSTLCRTFRNAFWFYATERLFYLNDLICQFELKNTFHLENDNMLYANLEEMLPIFYDNYAGIGAPFESDFRGFASFMFIRDEVSIKLLSKHLLKYSHLGQNEMILLNSFRKKHPYWLKQLPTLMPEYIKDHELITILDVKNTIDPNSYCNHLDQFKSLFDGASYGQYLGGIDPRNGISEPGYINPEAFFNCSYMDFEWIKDDLNRKIPYVIYKDSKYRISTLHIHSKNLQLFYSRS